MDNHTTPEQVIAALESHGCKPKRNGAGWKANAPRMTVNRNHYALPVQTTARHFCVASAASAATRTCCGRSGFGKPTSRIVGAARGGGSSPHTTTTASMKPFATSRKTSASGASSRTAHTSGTSRAWRRGSTGKTTSWRLNRRKLSSSRARKMLKPCAASTCFRQRITAARRSGNRLTRRR